MVKVKRLIFTYIGKQCSSTHLFNCSKFDIAIKNVKVNPRSSLEHFGGKTFKTFHEILCSKIFPCLILPKNKSRSTQDHYLNYLGITLVPLLHTKFQGYQLTV